MERKYNYLYKITNTINSKFYIGVHSTDNLEDGYLGSGNVLKMSIKKYGKENFVKEILKFFESRETLLQQEKIIVNEEMLKDSQCMNLILGGEGGQTPEVIKRWHKALGEGTKRKWTEPEYRETMLKLKSETSKQYHKDGKATYDNFKGKQHTEETKKRVSDINKMKLKGEGNSQFGTCWIMKDNENKKIKKDELQIYLALGWLKGRKMK